MCGDLLRITFGNVLYVLVGIAYIVDGRVMLFSENWKAADDIYLNVV